MRNTAERYGAVTIWLHWLTALAILAMLATAAGAWAAPDRPSIVAWLRLHGGIGMLIWLLAAARIAWHVTERRPRALAESAALHALARTVQVAMLVLIAFQLLSGPIDVWTGGWPIDIFGWVSVPSPIGTALKPWHDTIGTLHRYSGYAIAALLTLHIAAAVYHALIRRDGVLPRMLGKAA